MNAKPSFFIRSKNAGPFWLTIDVFCDDAATYERLCGAKVLAPQGLARLLRSDAAAMKTFRIPALRVIKISLPRPVIQGSVEDRDMHGAQWACLLQEALQEA
jgi:hypothetical protein